MNPRYMALIKKKKELVGTDTYNEFIPYNGANQTYIFHQNDYVSFKEKGILFKNIIDWCEGYCKNMTYLDIGAGTGSFTTSLASSCDKIYSFEPQKMTYYALCGSVVLSGLKNVTCLNYALGSPDQKGKSQLNILEETGRLSNILPSPNCLLKEEIEVKTLDDFDINNISFISIDVEGNESNVLIGAKETLKKNGYPVIILMSKQAHYANANKILTDYGYVIETMTYSNDAYIA